MLSLLIAPVGIGLNHDAQLTEREIGSIEDELQHDEWRAPSAERFVDTYGEKGKAYLVAVIQDASTPEMVKAKACFHLGKYGDPAAVSVLIAAIEGELEETVTKNDRLCIGAALDGLGFIGNADALSFLAQFAGLKYWSKLSFEPTIPQYGWDAEKTRDRFRAWAIRGIALASSEAAVEKLEELEVGDASDLAPRIRWGKTLARERKNALEKKAERNNAQKRDRDTLSGD